MYDIDDIDPEATIEVGSFRIDPNGNQRREKLPLSKSESHITGLVEKTCQRVIHIHYISTVMINIVFIIFLRLIIIYISFGIS